MNQHSQINGETSIAAIIGWPVTYTVSPQIHNYFYSQLGLNWCYIPLPIEPEYFDASFAALKLLSIKGFNVTMPYKELAAKAVGKLDDFAQAINAVNTVSIEDKTLVGHNTDAYGFLTALQEEVALDLWPQQAIILGAGGAARSITYALASKGCKSMLLINRSPARSLSLKNMLSMHFQQLRIECRSTVDKSDFNKPAIIVNATPIGMESLVDDTPIPPGLIQDFHIVYDLIYKPFKTRLLDAAQKRGAKTINGTGMLLHQAAKACEIWTGHMPDVAMARQELRLLKSSGVDYDESG